MTYINSQKRVICQAQQALDSIKLTLRTEGTKAANKKVTSAQAEFEMWSRDNVGSVNWFAVAWILSHVTPCRATQDLQDKITKTEKMLQDAYSSASN